MVGGFDLLARQSIMERLEHFILVFHSQLSTAFLADALLPEHMLGVENKWFRSHCKKAICVLQVLLFI